MANSTEAITKKQFIYHTKEQNTRVRSYYEPLEPVPRLNLHGPWSGLEYPDEQKWPQSLGHVVKWAKSTDGLKKLASLLDFYGYKNHTFWDKSWRFNDEEGKLSLEEACIEYPWQAACSFCSTIGVPPEIVEQFLEQDLPKKDTERPKKRRAVRETVNLRILSRETTQANTGDNNTKRTRSLSPPLREIPQRSPKFLDMLYAASKGTKESPASSLIAEETRIEWGDTIAVERMRKELGYARADDVAPDTKTKGATQGEEPMVDVEKPEKDVAATGVQNVFDMDVEDGYSYCSGSTEMDA